MQVRYSTLINHACIKKKKKKRKTKIICYFSSFANCSVFFIN